MNQDLNPTLRQFNRTKEHKVLRDPIHGYINIYYQVIWDLIGTAEFQRLRRIHQLGGTLQVYHTAEHSRFGHSLGVYEVVRLMIENVKDLKSTLNEFEQVAVMCAGLLHDLGHGPFSHSFETITGINHEIITDKIILENTQVNTVLKKAHPDLPQVVADIIAHRHERKLLSQMISSQMDADRMDYLLRDSYFTGVSYGEFDLFRILRTIRIVDDKMVVKESGIHAVEDYIMARYQMYWQVYLHPVSRSYESLLTAIFKRMRDVDKKLLQGAEPIIPFLNKDDFTIEEFIRLDESVILTSFMNLLESEDEILVDLAQRILNRNLFGYANWQDESQYLRYQTIVSNLGYDSRYYLLKDFMSQTLYQPYQVYENAGVWVLKETGKLVEISQASSVVRGFVRSDDKEDRKIFFPKEVLNGGLDE